MKKLSLLEQRRLAESPEVPCTPSRAFGILVVDDEMCVRDVLNDGMRGYGFAVWLAADGEEALDVYRRHHETIDVVLMDVCMSGQDGPQALAALRAFNPQVRCCFMTGDLGSYSAEHLHTLSAAAVLRKPFRLAEVARALGEHARQAPQLPSSP